MRPKPELSPRQQQILDFMRQFVTRHGYAPTVREIQQGITPAISSSSVVSYNLQILEQRGLLRRSVPGRSRAIVLLETAGNLPGPAPPAPRDTGPVEESPPRKSQPGQPTRRNSSMTGNALGTQLRALREQRGWPQTELARRSGLPCRCIAQLEAGAGSSLKLESLARLAAVLGTSLDDLLAILGYRQIAAAAALPDLGDYLRWKYSLQDPGSRTLLGALSIRLPGFASDES